MSAKFIISFPFYVDESNVSAPSKCKRLFFTYDYDCQKQSLIIHVFLVYFFFYYYYFFVFVLFLFLFFFDLRAHINDLLSSLGAILIRFRSYEFESSTLRAPVTFAKLL